MAENGDKVNVLNDGDTDEVILIDEREEAAGNEEQKSSKLNCNQSFEILLSEFEDDHQNEIIDGHHQVVPEVILDDEDSNSVVFLHAESAQATADAASTEVVLIEDSDVNDEVVKEVD